MTPAANPRTFQMPSNAWSMVKRIVRAYGAAQNEENSNVESVALLAGIHRPIVSGNNNFLRSIGVLEVDSTTLTALGVKLATGIGLDNAPIVGEALQEIVKTTPVLLQPVNALRARGPMDLGAFRAQIILSVGLNENSRNLPMVKTLLDLIEESKLIEIRDNKIFLCGTPASTDNSPMQQATLDPKPSPDPKFDIPGNGFNNPIRVESSPWAEMLLSKFPQFDPTWPDDVKLKWFDAFDRLMKGRGM